MMQSATHTLHQPIQKHIALEYLLYLPTDYDPHAATRYPLILFLHGSGERGTDLDRVRTQGLPEAIEAGQEVPAIVVAPQCPAHTTWSTEFDALLTLLDTVSATYPVDATRVYLTGLSMGGTGAWQFASLYPERFAALVPVCGAAHWLAGDPTLQIGRLHDVPVRVYHGALDSVIPVSDAAKLVRLLRGVGGSVTFIVYPDVDHNSWSAAYRDPELYTWLFQQRGVSAGG